MKAIIDNPTLQLLKQGKPLQIDSALALILSWSNLLECLDLGSLYKIFPDFKSQPIYTHLQFILTQGVEKHLLHEIFDRLFVEALQQIQALEIVDPAFLINQIQQKKKSLDYFRESLENYEKNLVENSYYTIHDLTLYFAWDRVCINLSVLFELSPAENKINASLEILKNALLESFSHIFAKRRTSPSFFRMAEALYAYDMREDNLDRHTPEEWDILCKCSQALRERSQLPDCYIDQALYDNNLTAYTLDNTDKINATLMLSQFMLKKLEKEIPDWKNPIHPINIVSLKEKNY